MRRAKAILVIVALLAIPLALLARSGSCEQAQCMCCLMHGAKAQHGKGMSCSHCAGKKCGMGAAIPDFGLNALMAPTAPAAVAALHAPGAQRRVVLSFAQSNVAGFTSIPFEPPRA